MTAVFDKAYAVWVTELMPSSTSAEVPYNKWCMSRPIILSARYRRAWSAFATRTQRRESSAQ